VIGFDDIDVAEVLGLSTVRQPLRETGWHGASLLLDAIHGTRLAPSSHLAELAVVPRSTT